MLSIYRAGKTELFENLDIVHIRLLVGGGLDVIRKEAWPFYRTISGVRQYWELEESK